MIPEQKAAYVYAQATAAHIEAMAMTATNSHRLMTGNPILYDEQDFLALIGKYGIDHNSIMIRYGE